MAEKKESPALERTYNVPLRKEYQKAPNWKRTEKAVVALRQFLAKHMKTDLVNVKLGGELNEALWKHGIKNPPHHVKVTVTKDKGGVVRAELFGVKKKEPKAAKKAVKEEKKEEVKEEIKMAEPPVEKPTKTTKKKSEPSE